MSFTHHYFFGALLLLYITTSVFAHDIDPANTYDQCDFRWADLSLGSCQPRPGVDPALQTCTVCTSLEGSILTAWAMILSEAKMSCAIEPTDDFLVCSPDNLLAKIRTMHQDGISVVGDEPAIQSYFGLQMLNRAPCLNAIRNMIEEFQSYTVGLFMDTTDDSLRFGILVTEDPPGTFVMVDTKGGLERTIKARFIVSGTLFGFYQTA
eukprot:TRINITY_DN2669_c0_g1_i1.p1 TRINITY_DN2669_c0_g1~~TRINITY_DN2669_c0_g1_i1.p1  ORF type:complete len:208 (-),score=48.59 TRINITY_DN2669_c0_g1_i1:223-846(-)